MRPAGLRTLHTDQHTCLQCMLRVEAVCQGAQCTAGFRGGPTKAWGAPKVKSRPRSGPQVGSLCHAWSEIIVLAFLLGHLQWDVWRVGGGATRRWLVLIETSWRLEREQPIGHARAYARPCCLQQRQCDRPARNGHVGRQHERRRPGKTSQPLPAHPRAPRTARMCRAILR